MEKYSKTDRLLRIFLSGLRGGGIKTAELAEKFGVSKKTINRDIADIRAFLDCSREFTGNMELVYSRKAGAFYFKNDEFLKSSELFAFMKILIGTRALSKLDLLGIKAKLRKFTSLDERVLLDKLVSDELYYYDEIKFYCRSLIDNLWQISRAIDSGKEITITYYKMDHSQITRRIRPVAVSFSEFYFYVFAYHENDEETARRNYRLDRITDIVIHRERLINSIPKGFSEGVYRRENRFMFPGKTRAIRFEFSGPSVQAVLDRLPTAKLIELDPGGKAVIEAKVSGDGIKMFLLSQGSWVKVLEPAEFASEMKDEIEKMLESYKQGGN